MTSTLELAKGVLNEKEYGLFEYMLEKNSDPRITLTLEELSKKFGVPVSELDNLAEEACQKVDRAVDLEMRQGDPEISEVYPLQNQGEYVDVIDFLRFDKNFDMENDVRRGRYRIQEPGETIRDIVDVGYFYKPALEFRAFKGTRLETALKEYKERQASSKE